MRPQAEELSVGMPVRKSTERDLIWTADRSFAMVEAIVLTGCRVSCVSVGNMSTTRPRTSNIKLHIDITVLGTLLVIGHCPSVPDPSY